MLNKGAVFVQFVKDQPWKKRDVRRPAVASSSAAGSVLAASAGGGGGGGGGGSAAALAWSIAPMRKSIPPHVAAEGAPLTRLATEWYATASPYQDEKQRSLDMQTLTRALNGALLQGGGSWTQASSFRSRLQ